MSGKSHVKAVCFDFMGTCLDWHTSIVAALPSQLSEKHRSDFALIWRQSYFDANAARQAKGEPVEDIDITHRRVLDKLLTQPSRENIKPLFSPGAIDVAIAAWHHQKAWPDVAEALEGLRKRGWEVYVHANGTTRLQLDLVRSSGLRFDMLFSSELLSVLKPDPESYKKATKLLKHHPEECVLVAAHAYDLRGAKAVGMRTVYVYRWTDDVLEDQQVIKGENDAYLEGMKGLGDAIEALESR